MKKYITLILKYIFSVLFIVMAVTVRKDVTYLLFGISELLLIFCISDYLIGKSRWFNFVNAILMLLFNAQSCVLYFGNSYITKVMLDNLDNLQDLEGRAGLYIAGVLLVVLFSVLPINHVNKHNFYSGRAIPVLLLLEFIFLNCYKESYTPVMGYMALYDQYEEQKMLKDMMNQYKEEVADVSEGEYIYTGGIDISKAQAIHKEQTVNIKEKPAKKKHKETDEEFIERLGREHPLGTAIPHETFGDDTNVIIIFVEGLSYNEITDSRNIMPNWRMLTDNSISFENYYNHTFATFRGIQGQLYSGFTYEDNDENHLTSIMDILKDRGYYTAFLNTEPLHETFVPYLEAMSFDVVLNDASSLNGPAASITDAEAYQRLYDTALAYNEEGRKFFLATYLFGTHASFDSSGEVYGDGNSPMLNKFYNSDYQLGLFLQQFMNSPLYANTMLVFTADHATYADQEFVSTFPKRSRPNGGCDEVPLCIYYQGKAVKLDAQGRNSLDLAPTVLDLLGLESSQDFLGQSLFAAKNEKTIIDTFFWDNGGGVWYTGADNVKRTDSRTEKYIYNIIAQYMARSGN